MNPNNLPNPNWPYYQGQPPPPPNAQQQQAPYGAYYPAGQQGPMPSPNYTPNPQVVYTTQVQPTSPSPVIINLDRTGQEKTSQAAETPRKTATQPAQTQPTVNNNSPGDSRIVQMENQLNLINRQLEQFNRQINALQKENEQLRADMKQLQQKVEKNSGARGEHSPGPSKPTTPRSPAGKVSRHPPAPVVHRPEAKTQQQQQQAKQQEGQTLMDVIAKARANKGQGQPTGTAARIANMKMILKNPAPKVETEAEEKEE